MNGTNDGNEAPVSLPSAKAFSVSDSITIQPPLSRRGHGPALIILVPADLALSGSDSTLDPPPLQKWAEEGFAVGQIQVSGGPVIALKDDLGRAVHALRESKACDRSDRIGVVCK